MGRRNNQSASRTTSRSAGQDRNFRAQSFRQSRVLQTSSVAGAQLGLACLGAAENSPRRSDSPSRLTQKPTFLLAAVALPSRQQVSKGSSHPPSSTSSGLHYRVYECCPDTLYFPGMSLESLRFRLLISPIHSPSFDDTLPSPSWAPWGFCPPVLRLHMSSTLLNMAN